MARIVKGFGKPDAKDHGATGAPAAEKTNASQKPGAASAPGVDVRKELIAKVKEVFMTLRSMGLEQLAA